MNTVFIPPRHSRRRHHYASFEGRVAAWARPRVERIAAAAPGQARALRARLRSIATHVWQLVNDLVRSDASGSGYTTAHRP